MDEDQSNRSSDSSASFDSLEFPELVKPNERIVKLNQEVIASLQAALKHNPEMNSLAIFPEDYSERRRGKRATSSRAGTEYKKLPPPQPIRPPAPLGSQDFCADVIALSKTATVIHPLSDEAIAFLSNFLEPLESSQALLDSPDSIMKTIKRMLAQPEKFAQQLGGLDGEGVKNDFMFGHRSSEVMTTAAEFEDFQFSACPRTSKAWVTFLRSFLPVQSEDCVFTHGDVWMANIMVKLDDKSNSYTVSGLIDWENSGFYLESQESIRLLSGLTRYTETDWHKYVPPCISPKRYSVHWLVHRLWRHTVENT
ncbi:hypothetical protein VF21_01404 [Pseudogymnoascus sp. 05NY08]|nr:hypothetical protein VF21_01404 [Pseudogymnoascus sp. 05NY08]